MAEKKEESPKAPKKPAGDPAFAAKKDHTLSQTRILTSKDGKVTKEKFHREIKAGDDCSDVPAHLLPALRTEGVIE